MHDAEHKQFRFGQIVKYYVRKSFHGPVVNAIVGRCTTFGICNQLVYGSPNTCHEIRAKIWLPGIVPFSSVKHVKIKERMVA